MPQEQARRLVDGKVQPGKTILRDPQTGQEFDVMQSYSGRMEGLCSEISYLRGSSAERCALYGGDQFWTKPGPKKAGVIVGLLVLMLGMSHLAYAQTAERIARVAIGAFAVATMSDLSTTCYCLGKGSCEEANPIFRPFQNKPLQIGIAKGSGAVLIGDVLLRQRKAHPKRTAVIASALAGAYFGLAYHNARFSGGHR